HLGNGAGLLACSQHSAWNCTDISSDHLSVARLPADYDPITLQLRCCTRLHTSVSSCTTTPSSSSSSSSSSVCAQPLKDTTVGGRRQETAWTCSQKT
ncbi:hypothetical protein JOB18_005335, partial [Solea senegalensis]